MQTLAAAGSAHEGSSFVSSYDPKLNPLSELSAFQKAGEEEEENAEEI
jgi:hypothetical protein